MKIVMSIFLFFISLNVNAQGIYSDYGIERIYCFSNNADIELELVQEDSVRHVFSSQGGDIFNITETVPVESVPNGVSFYLPNIDKSTIVVLIDDEDNVRFEGLSALTGSKKAIDFECELN